MKPHKHKDLIIQWANGAKIQYRRSVDTVWRNTREPVWRDDVEYRIEPREFEDGAWYPVIDRGERCVLVYRKHSNTFWSERTDYKESDLTWIGEKLDIQFPDC